MSIRFSPAASLSLLTAATILLPSAAQAQTRPRVGDFWPPERPIIVPPRPIPPREQELDLKKQRATVKVNGTLAQVKLSQEFLNPTDRQIEGTYLFPVPSGAAIGDFAMTVNGKMQPGEVLEGDKAREIYEGIVRRLRDPGILEFANQNVLKARIFPIAANSTVTVELSYTATLKPDGAGYRLSIPQRLPIGGAAESSTVDIEIKGGDVKAAYSPTHPVQVSKSPETTRVTGEWNAESVDSKDFVLLFTTGKGRVGLDVTVYRPAGEDPYFLLLAAPDASLGQKEVAAKDVVFVFDTSGSMEGAKIAQARKALLSLLGNLNGGDRFNIITFASDVRPFRDGLIAASPANLTAAKEYVQDIKAIGGTDIDEAVSTGMKNFTKDSTRPRQMVFMTDGQPTVGETRVENILKDVKDKNGAGVRLFSFGVGNDVNTQLLDGLAEENRGASDYVAPAEDIEAKVGALYKKIAYPVLTNPVLNWTGTGVYDVYPNKLPDLFLGTQAVVFGRLRGQEPPKVSLAGEAGGKTETVTGDVAVGSEGGNQIPRLWAVRKVGFLLDDARRNSRPIPAEVKDEIVQLSKKFGIITPLTAGLVTEDVPPMPVTRGGGAGRPMPMPGPASPALDALQGMAGNGAGGAAPSFDYRAARTGEAAVATSKALNRLKDGEQSTDQLNGVRTLAGKTFVLVNGVWTDMAYDTNGKLPVVNVKFATAEYFELAKTPACAQWLSVGDKVTFVWNGKVYKVEP